MPRIRYSFSPGQRRRRVLRALRVYRESVDKVDGGVGWLCVQVSERRRQGTQKRANTLAVADGVSRAHCPVACCAGAGDRSLRKRGRETVAQEARVA